jgi:Initiator Replication protein
MNHKTAREKGMVPIYANPSIKASDTVWESNSLITAHRNMNALEEKIFTIIISQVRAEHNVEEIPYLLNLRKLSSELNTNSKNTKDLVDAIEALQKTLIYIPLASGVLSLAVLSKVLYEKSGVVQVYLQPELKPLISDLTSNFTKYNRGTVLGLDSTYAIRMYKLICNRSFRNEPWVIELDLLYRLLDIPESYRRNFSDLKKRVITPTITMLAMSSIVLEYTPNKIGNKVTSITLYTMVELHNGVPILGWEEKNKKEIPPVNPISKEPTPLELLAAFYPDWIKNWRETCHFTDRQIGQLAQIDREKIKGTFYEIDQILRTFKPVLRRTYFWKYYTDMFPQLKPMTRKERQLLR